MDFTTFLHVQLPHVSIEPQHCKQKLKACMHYFLHRDQTYLSLKWVEGVIYSISFNKPYLGSHQYKNVKCNSDFFHRSQFFMNFNPLFTQQYLCREQTCTEALVPFLVSVWATSGHIRMIFRFEEQRREQKLIIHLQIFDNTTLSTQIYRRYN